MTNSKTDAGAALRPGIAGRLAPLGASAVAFLAVAQAALSTLTDRARPQHGGSSAARDQRRRRRGNCLVVLPVARAPSTVYTGAELGTAVQLAFDSILLIASDGTTRAARTEPEE